MAPGTLGGRVKSAMPVSAPLTALETTRPRSTATGGKEYATIYVSASDSHADSIATADFVCDGTDDGVTIDAAVAAVAASGGGRVILAEGQYYFGGPTYTYVTPRDGVVLQGQGTGTVLQFSENNAGFFVFGFVADGLRFTVRDIWFSASGLFNGHEYLYFNGNGHVRVIDCTFADMVGADTGVYHSGVGENSSCLVSGCRFLARTTPMTAVTLGSDNTVMENCYAQGDIIGGGVVTGCVVDNVGYILDADVAVGNIVRGGGSIRTIGGQVIGNVVSGSLANPGISAAGSRAVIVGNHVEGAGSHGIYVAGSSTIGDVVVYANSVVGCGQDGDNLYYGILLGGGGVGLTKVSVQANTVRHGGGANRHRYGIGVGSGVDAFVTNNDLKDSGRTGSFNDAGTGTITAAGNRL
jgi:hypothetical protein